LWSVCWLLGAGVRTSSERKEDRISELASLERDLKDAKFLDIGAEAAGAAYRAKILAAVRRSYPRAEGLTMAAVVTSFSGGPAPFCVPGYVTNDVVVAMVISFMERQPERIYEDFAALAPEAMQAAWPCKHSRQR
jgi:hypothetical protein